MAHSLSNSQNWFKYQFKITSNKLPETFPLISSQKNVESFLKPQGDDFQSFRVWHWRDPDLNSYRLAKQMNFREFLNKLIIFRVQEIVFNLSISFFCPQGDCVDLSAWFLTGSTQMPPILGYHLIFHKISKIFSSKSVFSLLLWFLKYNKRFFKNFLSGVHENMWNTQGTMKKESQVYSLVEYLSLLKKKITFDIVLFSYVTTVS